LKRRRLILGAAATALLVALPAGWYFGSPWWTLWQMRDAARAGDYSTLAFYIDSAALEADAKAQARRWWRGVLKQPLAADPEGAARWIARARRSLVELETRPQIALSDLKPWFSQIPIHLISLGSNDPRGYHPCIRHQGLDAFELRDERASEDLGPVLSFRRKGLGWRLVAARWGQQ